jgi:hypothetical protein
MKMMTIPTSNNHNGTNFDNLPMESPMGWLLDAISARFLMKLTSKVPASKKSQRLDPW